MKVINLCERPAASCAKRLVGPRGGAGLGFLQGYLQGVWHSLRWRSPLNLTHAVCDICSVANSTVCRGRPLSSGKRNSVVQGVVVSNPFEQDGASALGATFLCAQWQINASIAVETFPAKVFALFLLLFSKLKSNLLKLNKSIEYLYVVASKNSPQTVNQGGAKK